MTDDGVRVFADDRPFALPAKSKRNPVYTDGKLRRTVTQFDCDGERLTIAFAPADERDSEYVRWRPEGQEEPVELRWMD